MKDVVTLVKSDSRYKNNVEFGEPRSGHPEGKIRFHIENLEENLERIRARHSISEDDYWKLMFLIHIHDTFKAEVIKDSSIEHKRHHATVAREFAKQYTDDEDLLNMLELHDTNYQLWKEFQRYRNL